MPLLLKNKSQSKTESKLFSRALPVVSLLLPLWLLPSILISPAAFAQDKARGDIKISPNPDLKSDVKLGAGYKGYFLQQASPSQGSITIYYSPKHWQIRSAVFTIIVDEEHDSIIAYTRQTNKYIKDSLEVGKRRFAGFRHGGDFNWLSSKIIARNTSWQGHKGVVLERRGKRADLKINNDVIVTEQQTSLSDLPVSKTFNFIAFALFSQDYDNGMVVDVKRMAHSANPRYCTLRPVSALDTTVMKERTFYARDFVLPAGLTRVKTEIDMFSNEMEMPADLPIDDNVTKLRKRAEQLNVKTSK